MLKDSLEYYNNIVLPAYQNLGHLKSYELDYFFGNSENYLNTQFTNIPTERYILQKMYDKYTEQTFKSFQEVDKGKAIILEIEPTFIKEIVVPTIKVLDKDDYCEKHKIYNPKDEETIREFIIVLKTFVDVVSRELINYAKQVIDFKETVKDLLPNVQYEQEFRKFNRLPNDYK